MKNGDQGQTITNISLYKSKTQVDWIEYNIITSNNYYSKRKEKFLSIVYYWHV